MKKFNVLCWDFNTDSLIHYDVLPYFRKCIEKTKVKYKSLGDFKELIEKESRYNFWSRCEYEMICHGWPVNKNNYKIDVHEQVMMNIDVIAEILFEEYK